MFIDFKDFNVYIYIDFLLHQDFNEKKQVNSHKVTIMIYQWDGWCCLQSQKHVISGLNEEVYRRSTSDKWWFW